MTPAQKAYLASRWSDAALAEHASIAAFARFVLQLMGLGAPPELLREALDAANDEVRHAQACFAIASRFAGEPLGPGLLSLAPTTWRTEQPLEVLEAAIFEGCVAETAAAHCASDALSATTDAAICQVLRGIVEEEFRHSNLSWRFVAWMLERFPELASQARASFARALQTLPPPMPAHPDFMPGYGLLDGPQQYRSEHQAIERIVVSRYRSLFGDSLALERAAARQPESVPL